MTTVCQLFPAPFRAINLISYKWGFQTSKNCSSKFCEVRSPYRHPPVWTTLTWFTVKAEHAGSEDLIYFSVPDCPGLAGLHNKRGWWQSSFPENVLLRVSLLGKYSLANIYSTFDRKLKTKVPTVQAELARGHPELSACVYFWETGHCNDLLLISGKVGTFLVQNLAWKLSFSPCLNSWFSFLFTWGHSSFFSHYGKPAQLQSHPRLSPSGGW